MRVVARLEQEGAHPPRNSMLYVNRLLPQAFGAFQLFGVGDCQPIGHGQILRFSIVSCSVSGVTGRLLLTGAYGRVPADGGRRFFFSFPCR